MATIGRYILDENIRDIRIPLAITSGETLLASQRDTIERAFGCRVFDQYGCTELAFFAAEGACGRMHLSPDYSVLEIVDDAGNPLPPGRSGHVIGTSLINDAQILLRYRVGDVATLDPDACGCGSPLPVLRSVEGRAMNAIVLPDGHRLYRIGDVASRIPSVKQCQVVQEEIGVFTIYVVAAPGFGKAEAEQVAANFGASVGKANIRVEVVDRIRRGPGRKCASVISRVAAPEFPPHFENGDVAEHITIVVYSGPLSKRLDSTRRSKVAEVIAAAAREFGIAHEDRLLLAPAMSPGTALMPERTLDSYGIRNGMALVLTSFAAPARYRQGAYNGSPDNTPVTS
jgi:hypothetical protein